MGTSHTEIYYRAAEYCRRRESTFVDKTFFGFGVHGSVFACLRAMATVKTALKIHERETPYIRERDVYLRLRDLAIESIQGHHVPQLRNLRRRREPWQYRV